MPRQLLFSVTIKDCDVQEFRSGGPGGQHQNKVASGIRIRHRASGAVGESREHRSQLANKRTAFERMAHTSKFQAWHRVETARLLGQPSIEQLVDRAMDLSNIKFEVRNREGKWEECRA